MIEETISYTSRTDAASDGTGEAVRQGGRSNWEGASNSRVIHKKLTPPPLPTNLAAVGAGAVVTVLLVVAACYTRLGNAGVQTSMSAVDSCVADGGTVSECTTNVPPPADSILVNLGDSPNLVYEQIVDRWQFLNCSGNVVLLTPERAGDACSTIAKPSRGWCNTDLGLPSQCVAGVPTFEELTTDGTMHCASMYRTVLNSEEPGMAEEYAESCGGRRRLTDDLVNRCRTYARASLSLNRAGVSPWASANDEKFHYHVHNMYDTLTTGEGSCAGWNIEDMPAHYYRGKWCDSRDCPLGVSGWRRTLFTVCRERVHNPDLNRRDFIHIRGYFSGFLSICGHRSYRRLPGDGCGVARQSGGCRIYNLGRTVCLMDISVQPTLASHNLRAAPKQLTGWDKCAAG